MLLTDCMVTNANDNEQLSFIALSAATENVKRWLQREHTQDINGSDNTDRDGAGKSQPEREREDIESKIEYVDHRLKEIAAWERRINQDRPRNKKGSAP